VASLKQSLVTRQAGERLPSSRELVAEHRASPVTVSRALSALAAEGLIEIRPGAGSYVAPDRATPSPLDYSWQTLALADRAIDAAGLAPWVDPGDGGSVISLASGYPHPSLVPARALVTAFTRAARMPDAWDRAPAAGMRNLRAWFARSAGTGIDAADVVVTPGGQAAISAAFRAVVPAGEPLLVESPTYPGALAVARAAGIRAVPVPIDADGLVPDQLADTFARTGARALYCQPTFHNPTGAVLSAERRGEILAVARNAGAFIIEDDFAHWLSHGQVPPPTLLSQDGDGRVLYVTSLTKVASPSLRVGALIARGPVAARVQTMRIVDDFFVSRPLQEAAIDLVSRPSWERHVATLSSALVDRRLALGRALATHLPDVGLQVRVRGGTHLWVALPYGVDDVALAEAARRHGVEVSAGRPFFPAEAAGPHLRLTFGAAASIAELDEGVRRLAASWPGPATDRTT
jgi:DNA-binding transcriptional MocR family regulator